MLPIGIGLNSPGFAGDTSLLRLLRYIASIACDGTKATGGKSGSGYLSPLFFEKIGRQVARPRFPLGTTIFLQPFFHHLTIALRLSRSIVPEAGKERLK